MIKCYANKDRKAPVSVEVEGTIEEIVDDIGNLTHTLYWSLVEQGPELAEAFKDAIQSIFADEGSVWMTREELLKEADHVVV